MVSAVRVAIHVAALSFLAAIVVACATTPQNVRSMDAFDASPILRTGDRMTEIGESVYSPDACALPYADDSRNAKSKPKSVKAKSGGEPCADDMVLVDGNYCTEVRQDCIEWLDPPNAPFARCAKFAPSVCTGERIHKRYCIDRDEYAVPGESLPKTEITWFDAKRVCEEFGRRLCRETEWEFACEGEQMAPYSVGFERDSTRCHFDRLDLVDEHGKLRDYRKSAADLDKCISPFGARNMVGNVDEWVVRDRTPGEFRSALKGGWWMPARNRCRPATTFHNERYGGIQVGFRCCSDAH